MRLCVAKIAGGPNGRKGPPAAERPLEIETQSQRGFGETGRSITMARFWKCLL